MSTTDGISLLTPQAAIDGDNIIVVWHFRDNFAEGNYSVRGRLINLKTPLPGDDFQVSIDKSYGLEHLQVTASGGKAIAVWSLEDTNNFSGIQARVIDMKTGQLFGDNGFYVSTENDNFQYSPPRVVISGSKAIVAWLFEPYSTGSSSILGRLVDLSTGQPIGDKELVINTTEAAYLSSPCLSYYNNKILTLWKTVDTPANSDSIYGRFIDITTGQLTGTSDFIISAGEAPWRYNYLVSTSGERPLILWDSSNFQTGERALMGRYMDMPGEVLPGTEAFTVSTENAYQHASPQVGASDETAIAVWTYNGNIYGHALEISE
ncbi:MAG: hypothetical protein GY754_09165 [bacterium]|nr:hypothetical protein [bacterium]